MLTGELIKNRKENSKKQMSFFCPRVVLTMSRHKRKLFVYTLNNVTCITVYYLQSSIITISPADTPRGTKPGPIPMIKNLPALPMRDQIKQVQKIVSQSLENDFIPEGKRRAGLRDGWEQIEEQNQARAEVAISLLFDGRPIAAFLGSDFWVYAQSIQETEVIKEKARAYGFKRFETFVPKTGHPDDKMISIADPRGPYAVRVEYSESLIFGDHAKGWLALHEHQIKTMQDQIIYTYCHNADARFDFNDKLAASIMLCGLMTHYAEIEKVATEQGKAKPPVVIKMEKNDRTLDVWTVYLTLKV